MSRVPPYVDIDPIQPASRANELGVCSPDYGMITPNAYITNASGGRVPFKMLLVTTGGNIVIEKLDGTTATLTGIPDRMYLPTIGFRVMTAGTTASGIVWFSGKGGYNKIG
jgi:hypothetical protein